MPTAMAYYAVPKETTMSIEIRAGRRCMGTQLQPLTLMSAGLYNEPRGAYLPSIAF